MIRTATFFILVSGVALAVSAFGQTPNNTKGQVEIVEKLRMNPSVAKALEIVPEARSYVNPQNGDFDYPKARSEIGAIEARELRSKWTYALSDVRANA